MDIFKIMINLFYDDTDDTLPIRDNVIYSLFHTCMITKDTFKCWTRQRESAYIKIHNYLYLSDD